MWDKEFDASMLLQNKGIVVWCEVELYARELAITLDAHGKKWSNGNSIPNDTQWHDYEEDTCYWIEGNRVYYGSKSDAETHEYDDYIRCVYKHKPESSWDTPFDPALLFINNFVAIHCPTHAIERELAEVLTGLGITYPRGGSLVSEETWHSYEEEFCYYVDCTSLFTKRGSRSASAKSPYDRYFKCTFNGTPDFETADDAEMQSFLGF